MGFLHPAYWKVLFGDQQYFDFDQEIIGQRIMSSIHPFQGNLGSLVKDKPDFYGPIWYLITLVFTLSVLSNFSHYLAFIFGSSDVDENSSKRAMATFRFTYLLKALAVCFGSWILAPLTFMLGLLVLGKMPNGVQIAELFCIWGYSYIFYIFAAIISTLPVKVGKSHQTIIFFAFLAAACLASLMLISQLSSYLSQFPGNAKYVLLALVIGWEALIFFAFRFAFF